MQNAVIKYEPYGKRHLLPGVMPFTIGTLLYLTALSPLLPQVSRIPVLIIFFILTILAVAVISALAASLLQTRITRWRLMLPPSLLTAGAFMFHLMVGSPSARFITVTATMLLLFGFVLRLDALKASADTTQESVLFYGHVISLIGLFFVGVFGFGIKQFIQFPTFVTAFLLGGLMFAVAYEALIPIMITPPHLRAVAAAALGVIGTEFFFALSFLPTPFIVNAAVLIIVFFAGLRAVSRILRGDSIFLGLRIELALTLVLIVLIMATARWI
ncbi:hypothetical protein KKF05_01795 [Patescibacteria group bacterium]|nr:hypothetical protein [Patescibacteria group bacterium]MBU1916210.1 hypothetical protein [Patescibacteria group bacterium]